MTSNARPIVSTLALLGLLAIAAPGFAQSVPTQIPSPPPAHNPGVRPPQGMPGQGMPQAMPQGMPSGREPPPHAFEDCKGKRAGEAIQHKTPQGMVSAKCMDSPKGLFARPDQPPPGMPPGMPARPPQGVGPQGAPPKLPSPG